MSAQLKLFFSFNSDVRILFWNSHWFDYIINKYTLSTKVSCISIYLSCDSCYVIIVDSNLNFDFATKTNPMKAIKLAEHFGLFQEMSLLAVNRLKKLWETKETGVNRYNVRAILMFGLFLPWGFCFGVEILRMIEKISQKSIIPF